MSTMSTPPEESGKEFDVVVWCEEPLTATLDTVDTNQATSPLCRGIMAAEMAKPGRPTNDPKGERLTVRLSAVDLKNLRVVARERGVPLAEAARELLRESLMPTARKKG